MDGWIDVCDSWQKKFKLDKRQKERESSRADILLLAGRHLQWEQMMRIKAPAELKTFPCPPPLFKVRPFLALQLAEGRRPAKGRQPWHTVGWRLGERTRSSLAWALAVLKLCACDRRASRPSFPVISSLKPQITALWNWWAVRRDPAELSGADTLKWTGPGEMANSLISEGTATFWRLAADNVCSL